MGKIHYQMFKEPFILKDGGKRVAYSPYHFDCAHLYDVHNNICALYMNDYSYKHIIMNLFVVLVSLSKGKFPIGIANFGIL